MGLPRLNQTFNLYNQTFNAGGDSTLVLVEENIKCRYSLGQTLAQQASGDYISLDGFLHTNFDQDIQRDQIVKLGNEYYTVWSADKTRDLSGRNFFQFIQLYINKNVSI